MHMHASACSVWKGPEAYARDLGGVALSFLIRDSEGSGGQRKRHFTGRGQKQKNDDLFKYYVQENSTYTQEHFKRRFGVSRALFWRLRTTAAGEDNCFHRDPDARWRLGHSTTQKNASCRKQICRIHSRAICDGLLDLRYDRLAD
jgi:hypothetical protein